MAVQKLKKNIIKLIEKYAVFLKIGLILLLTLYVNFIILPSPKIPSDSLVYEKQNTTYLSLSSFNLNANDYNSGDLQSIFWKLILVRPGKDELCFEKEKENNISFFGSYNGGEFVNVTSVECFDISRNLTSITFTVKYDIPITIPMFKPGPISINDCIAGTINRTTGTCWRKISETQVYNLDDVGGKVYLKSNWCSELKKFIFLFFLVGVFVLEFLNVLKWIIYGSE